MLCVTEFKVDGRVEYKLNNDFLIFEIFSSSCLHGLILEFKERRLFEIKFSRYRKENTIASPLNLSVV